MGRRLRSTEIQNWTTEVSRGKHRQGEGQGLKQPRKEERRVNIRVNNEKDEGR